MSSIIISSDYASEVDALAESVRQLGEGRSGRLALAFDSATAWAPPAAGSASQ